MSWSEVKTGLRFECPAWSVLGWLLLLWPGSATAADPAAPAIQYLQSDYIVDSWQTEQGLPDNYINAIAQTPDGHLWVATFNGLARFNGASFVVFDAANTPELPSSRIIRLEVDRKGRLWIISEYGQLSYWTDGYFHRFGAREGLPDRGIEGWREDYAGEIWVFLEKEKTNFFHLVGNVFHPVHTTNSFFQRLGNRVDAQGHGWGIQGSVLFSVHPQNPAAAEVPHYDGKSGWRLQAARDGGMWVIAGGLQKFRNGHWESYVPLPVKTDIFGDRLEDHDGNFWMGTGIGELWKFGTDHQVRRYKLQNSTPTELGRGMLVDAEGNLWMGTGGNGLVRFKPRMLKTYDSRDGLGSDVVRSVTEDKNGNIWLATVNRVDWFPRHSPDRAESRGMPIELPWGVLGASDGSLWIATYAEGFFQFENGNTRCFLEAGRSDRKAPNLNVIFEDRAGQIHVGTPEGLYHVNSNALVKSEIPGETKTMDIRAMAEDSKGRLYFGLNGGGLLCKSKTGWERFTTREGLAGDHIWALHVDADDTVWIAMHGNGLSRFKGGKFVNFTEAQAELPRVMSCIVEDDTGRFWFGSNRGLFRAEKRQLNDVADGAGDSVDVTHYDQTDGMGSSQCTSDRQPTAWKARDGRLWFATMKGVTTVDPRSLPLNTRPPPLIIEDVLIDDHKVSRTRDRVQVGPGAYRLELRYAGLSFTAPDRVHYQYRLQGFDHDWVKAGNRRAAYYTKVSPGEYVFQVIACNNDNVWNQTGASLAVVVLPEFWQTVWFQFLVLISAGGLLTAFYWWRITQLHRTRFMHEMFSRRMLESQESERKRIAAELHDSLGQNLLVVKNYASMALRDKTTPDKVRDQLREISETTSASIDEVRAIARALRPYQLDRFGLSKTLEDAAELLARAGSLQIVTQIENVDGLFSPDEEISVYRVVQEWLNNVNKHAKARVARLGVEHGPGLVRILMADDGVGFDYGLVMNRSGMESSFGLTNLRERVRLLGGTLKIESAPGQGTRLSMELPVKK